MAKRTHTNSGDINSLVRGVNLNSDLHKDAFVTFKVRELSHTFHNFIGLACKEFYSDGSLIFVSQSTPTLIAEQS